MTIVRSCNMILIRRHVSSLAIHIRSRNLVDPSDLFPSDCVVASSSELSALSEELSEADLSVSSGLFWAWAEMWLSVSGTARRTKVPANSMRIADIATAYSVVLVIMYAPNGVAMSSEMRVDVLA